jgi:hypothetical protein
MNDNDVEELIARLSRPTPSPKLDVRIAELTNRAWIERNGSLTRRVLLMIGTAACAACAGFVLGRYSAVAAKNETASAPTAARALSSPSTETPERIRVLPAEGEALARFVMPPKAVMGLFGSGRLEARTSRAQLQ